MHMPKMDGFELIEEIRQGHHPAIVRIDAFRVAISSAAGASANAGRGRKRVSLIIRHQMDGCGPCRFLDQSKPSILGICMSIKISAKGSPLPALRTIFARASSPFALNSLHFPPP